MKLGVEGQRVGRAVSGSRADGANSLCGGLEGHRWTFVETVLFGSEEERAVSGSKEEQMEDGGCICIWLPLT